MKQGAGCIVGVDLVDVAPAAGLDHGGAGQKFSQQNGTAGAVNPREPGDLAAMVERDFLGFAQDAAGGGGWFGRAILGHPGAVVLRVNGGAAHEEHTSGMQALDRVFKAAEIDVAIHFLAATTRADCGNHRIRSLQFLRR